MLHTDTGLGIGTFGSSGHAWPLTSDKDLGLCFLVSGPQFLGLLKATTVHAPALYVLLQKSKKGIGLWKPAYAL